MTQENRKISLWVFTRIAIRMAWQALFRETDMWERVQAEKRLLAWFNPDKVTFKGE